MRHSAFVPINLPVGQEEEVLIEQQFVDPFQGQSSFASLTNESKDSFGCSHLTYLPIWFLIDTYPAFLYQGKALVSFQRLPLRLCLLALPTMGVP